MKWKAWYAYFHYSNHRIEVFLTLHGRWIGTYENRSNWCYSGKLQYLFGSQIQFWPSTLFLEKFLQGLEIDEFSQHFISKKAKYLKKRKKYFFVFLDIILSHIGVDIIFLQNNPFTRVRQKLKSSRIIRLFWKKMFE